ncbi:DUF6888 family protein [Nostoc sp.]|uniref:DUF6888 family protein n=1 Tax=Nostoc sp. TaxID=1180 RepID=UPI003FA57C29
MIIPTAEQTLQCFLVCRRLTMMYRPVYLVRLDERTGEIVIIAGEETEIAIQRDGKCPFKI